MAHISHILSTKGDYEAISGGELPMFHKPQMRLNHKRHDGFRV